MGINEWPEQDRPRERLVREGARALSSPELLAIFLRVGSKSAVICWSNCARRPTPD